MAGSAAAGAPSLPCAGTPSPRAASPSAQRALPFIQSTTWLGDHLLTGSMIRAMSTGSVPRGARTSELRHKTNSAARAALRWGPSLAAASLGGRRGESGFCVSSLAAAAVGAVTGRERRRGRGSAPGLLAPRWGGGCCRGSATPLGSPSLRGFSSWLALPRVAALMEGAAATRPQPTCPFASCARVKPPARPAARRKWRGASCHPKYLSAALGCGARAPRAPRPLAAARSRPRGRRQPRQARARARAGTRPDAGVRLSVRQVRATRSVAFPPSGPPRDGGGRGARARRRRPWRRPGFQPRFGRSASQPVSQSVRCRRRECGSEGPLSGRGGGGTGCPPVERRMLRQLRRYLRPRRRGVGDAAEFGGYSGSPGFPRSRPPRCWVGSRGDSPAPRTPAETEAWNAADGDRAPPARNAAMTRQEGRCCRTAPGAAPALGSQARSLEPSSAGRGDSEGGSAPRAFWRAWCLVFGQLLRRSEHPVPILEDVLLFSDILV